MLWPVMSDANIQKILYSGSEDLALLHSMGCEFRNVCDVQICAYLANHEARGLSDLIAFETGRKLSKNAQLSDWSKRPLSPEQRQYAANDVNTLLEIADQLVRRVEASGLLSAMMEEFGCLEEITPRDFSPKLKPNYYREYSAEYCRVLLEGYVWRDECARMLNVPPHFVASNELLERYIFMPVNRGYNATQGFHPVIARSEEKMSVLFQIIDSYDPLKTEKVARGRQIVSPRISRAEESERVEKMYNPVRDRLIRQHGEVAGTYLLRNIKRHLLNDNADGRKLRNYQEHILQEMRSLT
jgi:ribonuclease D